MESEMHFGAPPRNFVYSKENRKRSTEAEEFSWSFLRGNRLADFKFRSQHPISDFIADFYCHECRLVIEIDGEYHNDLEQSQYDEGRTYELNEFKVKVLRFTNKEVLTNIKFVRNEIKKHLTKNTSFEDHSPDHK